MRLYTLKLENWSIRNCNDLKVTWKSTSAVKHVYYLFFSEYYLSSLLNNWNREYEPSAWILCDSLKVWLQFYAQKPNRAQQYILFKYTPLKGTGIGMETL